MQGNTHLAICQADSPVLMKITLGEGFSCRCRFGRHVRPGFSHLCQGAPAIQSQPPGRKQAKHFAVKILRLARVLINPLGQASQAKSGRFGFQSLRGGFQNTILHASVHSSKRTEIWKGKRYLFCVFFQARRHLLPGLEKAWRLHFPSVSSAYRRRNDLFRRRYALTTFWQSRNSAQGTAMA